jgi:hypothetical protein
MPNVTETRIVELQERVRVLEQVAHRVLLVIGVAGSMLAEIRHDDEEAGA